MEEDRLKIRQFLEGKRSHSLSTLAYSLDNPDLN